MKKLFRYFLTFVIFGSGYALAQAPVINSAPTASATLGVPFSYEITTVGDDALVYGVAGSLPEGVTRSGAILSGTPKVSGNFTITLSATNASGSGTLELLLAVTNPLPNITSDVSAQAQVGSSFSYQITTEYASTSYSAVGIDQIGGLTLDATTGSISGVPINDGNFDVLLIANNSAGQSTALLNIVVFPAQASGGVPTIEILSPTGGSSFEGNINQIFVSAVITPSAIGEVIENVYVQWLNPPLLPSGQRRSPITLGALSLASSDGSTFTYEGNVNIGFNPDDRELGGGLIDLRVFAYQSNATTAGYSSVEFNIAPIIEYLFPQENIPLGPIKPGDIFASVRINTNDLLSVNTNARIVGTSLIDSVTGTPSLNGIYNFSSTTSIDFPGIYEIEVTATDTRNNLDTSLVRSILISEDLSGPVAVLNSPTPGFVNEVFSAATFSIVETDRTRIFVNGVFVGFDVEYDTELITSGQGYFPRDANDIAFTGSAVELSGSQRSFKVTDLSTTNGRISSVEPITISYRRFVTNASGISVYDTDQEFGNGFIILDDVDNPGFNALIPIAAEFFQANAALQSYKIYVNGMDVTPGSGNLNSLAGTVDIPVLRYPAIGSGPPLPGDYLVNAQVVDLQGEIGNSEPLTFSITPYEPLSLQLSRTSNSPIAQGDSATFSVVAGSEDQYNRIVTVKIYDSDSGEEIGTAPKVTIDGEKLFILTERYTAQGSFGRYAEAVASNGQKSRSDPIRIEVQPVNDLTLTINSPLADQQLFAKQALSFTAEASATPGVASVKWFINNELVDTDLAEPFALDYTFDQTGIYTVTATATDNFGNLTGAIKNDVLGTITGLDQIVVTVVPTDLVTSLTVPTTNLEILLNDSVDFAATASATLGVATVRWYVNGELESSDTQPPYTFSQSFTKPGSFSVYAEAEDSLSTRKITASRIITVNTPNPLKRNRDFVVDIYSKFLARTPTESESIAALGLLNNTLSSRAQWLDNFITSLPLNAVATNNSLIATNISLIATNNSLIANNNSQIEPDTTKNQIDPDTTNYDTIYMIYRTMLGRAPSLDEFTAAAGVTATGLISSLVSAYQELYGAFPTSVSRADQSAIPLIAQLFVNKHGEAASLFNQSRLRIVLTGDTYLGNTVNFVAAFAADNLLSGNQHSSGPLSNDLSYVVPNDATASIPLALAGLKEDIQAENIRLQELIEVENTRLQAENTRLQAENTRLQEENLLAFASIVLFSIDDPNDVVSAVSAYQGLTFTQAIELMLADARYYNQFPKLYTEGYVANRMAQLGIFDLSKNSASADSDNDSQSNLYELALGSNPINALDTVPPLTVTQEDTGFIVRYIQIDPATTPSDLVISVDSSLNLLAWSTAAASIASDQSNVPAGYIRYELLIDAAAQPNLYIRVGVN